MFGNVSVNVFVLVYILVPKFCCYLLMIATNIIVLTVTRSWMINYLQKNILKIDGTQSELTACVTQ